MGDRLTKRQREFAETRMAAAQGRTVRVCGNCGAIGVGHWVPDHLDPDLNVLVFGAYTCEEAS